MIFENLEHEITKLYRYCLKLSNSTWLAEDLVQETILKVYRLKQLDSKREFNYSFLCKVARNLFIDEKRKQKVQLNFSEDLHGGNYNFPEYDSLIEILLSSLPLKQSMLITLKDVFGYSIKEIATMLRVSTESIKTALHRSRKKLRTPVERFRGGETANHKIIVALSNAIKENKPMKIFYYYRLLEAQNFQVRKSNGQAVCHVIDPDGNILQLQSS